VDINSYAVEVLAKARLDQLRADAARHAALAAEREPGAGLRSALASLLMRAGRRVGRQGMARARHA
jgi:hypothetical protein